MMLMLAALPLSGCSFGQKSATQSATQPASEHASRAAEPVFQTVLTANAQTLVYRLIRPEDPPLDPEAFVMIQLDVYDIAAPAGTLSGNADFLALLAPLPAPQQAQLLNNGIRVGTAAQERWDAFKKIFEARPVKTTPTTIIGTSGRAELSVQTNVAAQTLFYFDAQGQLVGRSFDSCDNFWAVRFHPVLHKAGVTDLFLSPTVRAARRHMEYNGSNGEMHIDYVQPESLYDVGLSVQLPRERFLVVAPTAEAVRQSTTLASAFLLSSDAGQKLEHIYVLSPRLYLFDEAQTLKAAEKRSGQEAKP